MYCKYCGKPVSADSRFCPFCGKMLVLPGSNIFGLGDKSNNSASNLLRGLKKNQSSFVPQNDEREFDNYNKETKNSSNESDFDFEPIRDDYEFKDSVSDDAVKIDGLPIESIEELIGTSQFTQDMFVKHTKLKCWGCGKYHDKPYKQYLYTLKKTKRKSKGAAKYSVEYSKSAYVCLCPDCFYRLSRYDLLSATKEYKTMVIDGVILAVFFIASLIYFFSTDGVNFPNFFGALFLSIAVGTVGQIILIPISYLIAGIFYKIDVDNKTKWSFDDIPVIRRFNKYM